jgi:DNA-damage-inducible protein J
MTLPCSFLSPLWGAKLMAVCLRETPPIQEITMQAVETRKLKSAEIRSRIEPDLKEKSIEVLASLGLDLSDAIRLFLRKVVDEKGLPFAVRQPNATTIAAMVEARESTRERFEKSESLFDALESAPKEKARKPS